MVEWTGSEMVEKAEQEEEEEAAARGGFFHGGELNVLRSYEGHGSIAYGADWGWRRLGGDVYGGGGGGGEGQGEGEYKEDDVVVSCSFYDKGLHVWSPRVD